MKGERGSLALFGALVFPGLVLFAGALTDLVRIRGALSAGEEAVLAGTDSILADYDRELFSQWGILALRDKDYGADFRHRLAAGLPGTGLSLLAWEASLGQALDEPGILEEQIMEEMKLRGLVSVSKELLAIGKAFLETGDLSRDLSAFGDTREEAVQGIQEKVALNMEEIRTLEERKKGGEEGLEGRIEGLYQENRNLLVAAEDLSGDGGEEVAGEGQGNSLADLSPALLETLRGLFQEAYPDLEKELKKPGALFFRGKGLGGRIREALKETGDALQRRFLLASYVLDYCSTYESGGSGQAEKILGDGYGALGLLEVLGLRTLLDGSGYFFLDPKAPPEPVSRLLYAAGLGLVTGLGDGAAFLTQPGTRVPLVHGEGLVGNPFEGVRLSYGNHLALLLAAMPEERILEGVYGYLSQGRELPLWTEARGRGVFSLPLWFLQALPQGTRILGGEVRDGCFIFEKEGILSFH